MPDEMPQLQPPPAASIPDGPPLDATAPDAPDLAARLQSALAELDNQRLEHERLERELADTNRGVVALYAELDDKAEQLRRANEAKTRFLSGVSHELRTPLNSILALSKLLLDEADGPLTPEQQRQVGYVRKSAEDLLGLVNSLLDLSRIEAGRAELLLREFELGDLFRRIEGEMQPLLRGRDVRLVFEHPSPDVACVTDEGKVAQIVRNFVSNALKYTERGEIRVVGETRAAGAMRISVVDTGIGIGREDLERVFEEFIQLPGPLQTRTKGTGLGLPLSRALGRVLGGRVGVESEIGVGSTFWVEVPVRHASAVLAHEEPPDAPGATASRVLVIDDDPVHRYVVSQMLRAEGHEVVEATGGIEGLARARSISPSLIVLDLSMPDLDGAVVLDRLKEEPATWAVPVIVHSARELTPAERTRIATHAAAILPKGGDVDGDLREAVRVFAPVPVNSASESARSQR